MVYDPQSLDAEFHAVIDVHSARVETPSTMLDGGAHPVKQLGIYSLDRLCHT